MGRKKSNQAKANTKIGNRPRHVRMPPVLDEWLEQQVAGSNTQTVADRIRQIIEEARNAQLRQQEEAA